MKLDRNEERRKTAINSILKKMDIHELAKNKIFTCNTCRGTGLAGIYFSKKGNAVGWDCKSFCPKCKGIGYTGNIEARKITNEIYLCKQCYGAGCSKCKNKGTIDWVSYLMGG